MAHPGGRPTDYNYELIVEICDKIASTSKGLNRLCKENPHWPSRKCIYEWLLRHKEFSDLYAKAKSHQADFLFEECFDIADDTSRDTRVVGEDEREVCNSEWINRSRLRVDLRKWVVARLAPHKYGDHIADKGNDEIKSELSDIKGLISKCVQPIPQS